MLLQPYPKGLNKSKCGFYGVSVSLEFWNLWIIPPIYIHLYIYLHINEWFSVGFPNNMKYNYRGGWGQNPEIDIQIFSLASFVNKNQIQKIEIPKISISTT